MGGRARLLCVLAAVAAAAVLPAARAQTVCPGFGDKSSTVYVDGASGCLVQKQTMFGGDAGLAALNTSTAASASICAQNCTTTHNCNVFNYCSNPYGCCTLAAGCSYTSPNGVVPFQTCILRSQASLQPPSLAPPDTTHSDILPSLVYDAGQATQWDATAGRAAGLISSSHAMDSGICGNITQDAGYDATETGGFCQVLGADLHQHDFKCVGIPNVIALDQSYACHVDNITLEDAADQCYNNPSCSALVYQEQGCCNRSDYSPSAWFKTGTVTAAATSLLPYSSLYIKTGSARPAPPAPHPPAYPVSSSSSNAGAIAGGVIGGVVGAALLSAAVLAFVVRRRTGRWPLGKAPESPVHLGHSMASSDDQGAILINHRFGDSTASSRSRSRSALSSGRSGSTNAFEATQDATALLRKLQSTQFGGSSFKGNSQGWRVRPNEIDIMQDLDGKDVKLGEGGFGAVFKGVMNKHLIVAVKILKGKQDERTQKAFQQEISILSSARHPYMLQFLGAVVQQGRTFLITEFMDGGSLWSALAMEETEYTWHKRGQHVACQIAQALAYLHTREQPVLHLDLKSQNVLLSSSGQAKLADVGLARVLQGQSYTRADGTGFTWAYASPEVLVGDQCTIKADVWSLGVLLHEIVTCEVPQRGCLRNLRVPEDCPAEIDALIMSCLQHDSKERPHTLAIVDTLRKATGLSH